jgi:hypothetical protein
MKKVKHPKIVKVIRSTPGKRHVWVEVELEGKTFQVRKPVGSVTNLS